MLPPPSGVLVSSLVRSRRGRPGPPPSLPRAQGGGMRAKQAAIQRDFRVAIVAPITVLARS